MVYQLTLYLSSNWIFHYELGIHKLNYSITNFKMMQYNYEYVCIVHHNLSEDNKNCCSIYTSNVINLINSIICPNQNSWKNNYPMQIVIFTTLHKLFVVCYYVQIIANQMLYLMIHLITMFVRRTNSHLTFNAKFIV